MTQNTVTSLLNEWPDRQSVHVDAKVTDPDIDIVAVHRWFQRGAVPVKYWPALIEGGRKRGIAVDAERLLAAHARVPVLAVKIERETGGAVPATSWIPEVETADTAVGLEHERGAA